MLRASERTRYLYTALVSSALLLFLTVPRDLPFYPMSGRKALDSCFIDP